MNIPGQNACNCIVKKFTVKGAFSAKLECTFPVLGPYIIHVSRWQVSIMYLFLCHKVSFNELYMTQISFVNYLKFKLFSNFVYKISTHLEDVLKPYFAWKTCKSVSQKCLLHCMAKLTSKTWNDLEEFRMIYKMEEEGLSVKTTPQSSSES